MLTQEKIESMPGMKAAIERTRAYEQRCAREQQLQEVPQVNNESTQMRLDSAKLQALYDPAYHQAGLGAAPPRVFGESNEVHERRLLAPLVPLSATYAKVDFGKVGDMNVVRAMAAEIRRDAVAAGRRNEGELREVVETDATGRRITRFYGAPGAAWNRFKMPYRFVKSFNGERVF